MSVLDFEKIAGPRTSGFGQRILGLVSDEVCSISSYQDILKHWSVGPGSANPFILFYEHELNEFIL